MLDLNQKLAAAKAEYEAANLAFQEARNTYENGSKNSYANLLQNIAALKAEIKNHEAERATAKQALADGLQVSNGAKTQKVKDTLDALRDSDAVLEECDVLLQQLTTNAEAERINGSAVAETYQQAYRRAQYAWAVMNTYTILAECGERLSAAMAVQAGSDEVTSLAKTPKTIILTELEKLAAAFDGDKKPYLSEIGTLDLGPFDGGKMMTPGERHQARIQAQASA